MKDVVKKHASNWVGQKIRTLREGKFNNIPDFAEQVGVDPVYITQIERHGKLPSPRIMKLILDKLRILPEEKLGIFFGYLSIKHPEIAEIWLEMEKDKEARAGFDAWLKKQKIKDPASLTEQLADMFSNRKESK